jgi:hypothetical protein
MVRALEADRPRLHKGSDYVFALASAWAERHDAILACAPPAVHEAVAARLERLGIRWGLAPGARVTREFPALKAHALRRRVGER